MDERTLLNSGPHHSDVGGSIFQGASNINIQDSTFNAYEFSGWDEKNGIAEALALISSCAEKGAPYDAAARGDVPKCHEQTRVSIIDGIHNWAHSKEPNACPLMWMYGPAGSGKTTIMQTVAETFDQEESLAASFFFSRLSAERPRDKEHFVITIAHQLSLCIPTMREPLAEALLESDILTKSLAKQLDALVIGPLKTLEPAKSGARRIFLVDGLDKCDGDTAQRDVLNLLEHLLHQTGHRFRILVASRSLSHIRSFFAHGSIGEITQTTPLDNDYQSDADITQFFYTEFAKIRVEHPSRGWLGSEWPFSSDIDSLVKRASGQFIYASVVMKYIADHGRHPDESLQTIVNLVVDDSARPYEALDAVYAQVLSTIEPQNVDFVQTLVGCLLLNSSMDFYNLIQTKPTRVLDDVIFMTQPGTTDARINRMSPLITTNSDGMKFTHASFPDYLLDRSRSKEFFFDIRKVCCTLARHWFKIYSTHFEQHPHSGLIPSSIESCFPGGYTDRNYRILVDVVYYSLRAEWTAELQQGIPTFNVEAAFTASPKYFEHSGEHLLWNGISLWLDFIFWIEQNRLLSSTETAHILGRIHKMIQAVLSELEIDATVRRYFAGLLTLRKNIDILRCWHDFCRAFGPLSEWKNATDLYLDNIPTYQDGLPIADDESMFQDHIRDTSSAWLCQTLAMGAEMDSTFFFEGKLYTDMALLYARSHDELRDNSWMNNLPVMLSKSAPSEELANLLKQKFLQIQRSCFDDKDEGDIECFFMAISVYLFQCHVPFLSEHHHRPEFHPYSWSCGVCILFDPFGDKCTDLELSRYPDPQPTQILNELPPLAQLNPVWRYIPGTLLLWLRAWTFWLADMTTRFFPVVA